MISIIVAVDEANGIGKDGKLPWHNKEDLNFFRKTTLGKTIIMGKNTFLSLGQKPLRDRYNIVVSSSLFSISTLSSSSNEKENLVFVTSIEEAFIKAKGSDIYVIGGASIYEQCLSFVDRIIVTHIPGVHSADTFFSIDLSGFKGISYRVGSLTISEYMR